MGDKCKLSKKELIELLIKDPKAFSEDMLKCLLKKKSFSGKDLRKVMLRLFDVNDDIIRNDSSADKGAIGWLNKKSMKKREQRFWRKINRGSIDKVILAEGDSWFEYPVFIKEIIDQLNKRKRYAVYSLAYGADWISNILYEQQYIEKLSLLNPDVFLISGGGNDIVGGYRLAQLVKKRKIIDVPGGVDLSTKEGKLQFANLCFNDEFKALLWLFKLQYHLLFRSIKENTHKFSDLKIITQGYDYAIPSSKKGFGLNVFRFMQPLTNWFVGNGKWLNKPLLLRGYQDKEQRTAIVYGMIEYFNEVLIEVGNEYENVFHVDSRGSVNAKRGWYNELHPHSYEFKKIANTFEKCIDYTGSKQKIFKVNKA